MKPLTRLFVVFCAAFVFTACTVNPVTGKTELAGMSEASQIELGEQNYEPMQQSQGWQYDVDPELTEYVRGVGAKLAAVSDRELPYEFSILNSSVPNAWALPGGKIAINRGLLTELGSEAELAAVLGHEIVHAAAGHTAQRVTRGQLLQVLVLGTAVATSDASYGGIATGGANVFSQLLNQSYGRGDELESDQYGMLYMSRAGYDPQGAVTLQRTFVRLSEGRDEDWLSGLFASHPPSQERVEANIRTAAGLPPGGELGVERYRAAMAKTMAAKPAYDAYDEGRKALGEGNPDKAVEKAVEAIGIFPDEANFYALKGDARMEQKKFDKAVTNYNNAIRRRDNFFYYYLQRGRAHEELGHDAEAKADLERSIEMLPTGPAYYSLGKIAERQGDKRTAIEHYRKVAGGQGELATSARTALVRLDLENNPDDYIPKRCDADSSGELIVSVKNDTPLTIGGIVVSVQYNDANGIPRRVDRRISGPLSPGQVASVGTGLGPYTSSAGCPARITAARVLE